MKTKSKNRSSKQSQRILQRCGLEPEISLTLSFRACLYIFSFSLAAACLSASPGRAEIPQEQLSPIDILVYHLTPGSQNADIPNAPFQAAKHQPDQHKIQTGNNTAVNSAAQVDEKSLHLFIAENPYTELGRQLWRARISVPKAEKDIQSKNQLQQIIKQIRSVEFELSAKTPEYFIVTEPVQETEPNEIPSDTEATEEQKRKKIEHKLPYEPVTEQTLKMFESLSKHPEQLHNPLELGKILFRSGNLKQAAVCYQQALNSKSTDAPSARNTAWILLQIGNCVRDDEPLTAIQMYRRVITEHPNSPWVDLARTRIKLTEWFLNDKPKMLIENGVSKT